MGDTMTEEIVLAKEPLKAVKQITELAEGLAALMEREEMAMTTQDAMSFNALQDEKERFIEIYQRAVTELHERLDDFQAVDELYISKMEEAQNTLREKTEHNLELITKFEERKQQQS